MRELYVLPTAGHLQQVRWRRARLEAGARGGGDERIACIMRGRPENVVAIEEQLALD